MILEHFSGTQSKFLKIWRDLEGGVCGKEGVPLSGSEKNSNWPAGKSLRGYIGGQIWADACTCGHMRMHKTWRL